LQDGLPYLREAAISDFNAITTIMEPTALPNRDKRREELRKELEPLGKTQREQFRAVISKERDNELLADLRYDFRWDPDPRKSTWQAIEINRLITKRNKHKEARPQWIAIIVSSLLALAALIVSILTYLHDLRTEHPANEKTHATPVQETHPTPVSPAQ
jgi:hypothetical protein